jgi:2-aminoadipate transaminase
MNPVDPLRNTPPSYIREILSVVASKDIISLAGGLPCPNSFPMDIIETAMGTIANDKSLFQYAATAGYTPLINTITERYHVTDSHDVLITNGSQQGIDLCARVFINKGDKIIAEAPSYLGALQIFSIAQATLATVDQEHDGPNIEQLEAHFIQGDVSFFYAIPDFNNPTGCCWSLEKRQQVAALCIRYKVLLIEDSPYREIRFNGESLPTVASLCSEYAISLFSFSKMIAPGLRIGALITPKRYFSSFSKLKQATDLHTNVPLQALTHSILNHAEFHTHLAATNQRYKARYQALLEAITSSPFYEKCKMVHVDGGMFIWLTLPDCDVYALARAAIEKGVAIVPSTEFYSDDKDHPSAVRINFSYNAPNKIQEGISRLNDVFKTFIG